MQVVPRPHSDTPRHEKKKKKKGLVETQLASVTLIFILIRNNRVGSAAAVLFPTLAKRTLCKASIDSRRLKMQG